MANLKVFVSSTCYDLHATRAQLRNMLTAFGYEPVMSDQADVIYDPRVHTHTSCLREVANCDIVVLLVGSRFGGAIVPKALELVDLERLGDLSRSDKFGEDKTRISITQAEIVQAIQVGLPVFAFIDSGVMRDHLTYEKNKNKSIIGQIEFSSIDRSDTAPYIFEFINFLRLRNENNSIFEFSRFEDIENQLKKQWGGLFQRLLHEQRTNAQEGRRIDNLSGQIADLKAAVIGSISNSELKQTAKGAIRYRLLLDFLFSIATEYKPADAMNLLHSELSWSELLKTLGIVNFVPDNSRARVGPSSMILLREDETYYRVRQSVRVMPRLSEEWDEFRKLGRDTKDAILNAILDSKEGRPTLLVRHYNEIYVEERPVASDDDVENQVKDIKRNLNSAPRILLTKDKFIEESLKNYINVDPVFKNMTFMINVKDDEVDVSRLPIAPSTVGITKSYKINYPADDNLGPELERLRALLLQDFGETAA